MLANLGLDFSTYLGGSGPEQIRDVATDAQGNVYVTGGTASSNFPATRSIVNPGTAESTAVSAYDVFVTKYTPQGKLVWSTRLGGPNYDRAYALELDPQGSIYVAGRAGAAFPVTRGAFQTEFQGGQGAAFYGRQDGFVAKLSPDGGTLLWASYFGTSDDKIVRDIAVDDGGAVYLTSSRASGAYTPAVAAAFARGFQPIPGGGMDSVAAKVDTNGTQVLWASYIGGTKDESAVNSIRVDALGQAHVLLQTTSADVPTTRGAHDRGLSGPGDLFIAKFNAAGTGLLYGTYLGGSQGEGLETHELALDPQGRAVVATLTMSADFPTTPGAFQRTHAGNGGPGTGAGTNYPGDAFVARLSLDGSTLEASTFLGGRYGEGLEGVSVDAQGNVYVSGATYSDNFPTTPGAVRATRSGPADMFAAKLSPDLGTLLYSTYLGGGGIDHARTSWSDAAGNFHVAGETVSGDLPTRNAHQATFGGGGSDAALARFSTSPTPPPAAPAGTIQFTEAAYAANERRRRGIIPVTRTGGSAGAVTVRYSTLAHGTATSEVDYTPISGTLTWADGDTETKYIRVRIGNDADDEPDETLGLTLTAPTGGAALGTPTTAVLTIVDNDPPGPTPPPAGTNLLRNPGFEDAGAWEKSALQGRSIVGDPVHAGSRSLRMTASSLGRREVYQDVEVTAGAAYDVSGWLRVSEIEGGDGAFLQILWMNGEGTILRNSFIGGRTGTSDWTRLAGRFEAPDGATKVRVRLVTAAEPDNAGSAWFDDLSLARVAGA